MMRIDALVGDLPGLTLHGTPDADVTSITLDSRAVRPGALFAALPGREFDGKRFIDSALAAGAAAILSTGIRPAALHHRIAWLESDQPRVALAAIARRLAGAPDERLRVIGVTGTKGKTTCVHMLEAALNACDVPTAIGGTLGQRFGEQVWESALTTAEAPQLWSFLHDAADAGAQAAALEVSSIALDAARVHGVRFAAAILTGIGHDHLDVHGTHDRYRRAKRILFEMLETDCFAVLPADDPYMQEFAQATRARCITFGSAQHSDWRVSDHRPSANGATFNLTSPNGTYAVESARPGHWDALNLAAAAAVAENLGAPIERALSGLRSLVDIPGRFERIDAAQPFLAVVDYAHTPESLERVLRLMRQTTVGRLICVFGCGGERDREKRPQMGRLAAEIADIVVITDDNPRHEDPARIAHEILAGSRHGHANVQWISPREAAIAHAVDLAADGDALLVAGKGHETYQDIGGIKRPFDDRRVLRAALAQRWGRP
ncbi:MAG: UDP-N-acetylmuramoyl-L-alanyl-D-glutamate--2,6-diaminopimelate ligase [Acidobacteriota bacterium]